MDRIFITGKIDRYKRWVAVLGICCLLFAVVNYTVNVRYVVSDFQHGSKRAKTQLADKTLLHLSIQPAHVHEYPVVFNDVAPSKEFSPIAVETDFTLHKRPPPSA